MSLRNIASIAIALLLGIVAVLLIRGVMTSKNPPSPVSTAGLTPVVVAAVPIERGVTLKPVMLKVVNYPNNAVPPGAFKTVAEVAGSANARTVLRSLGPSEPLMAEKLSGSGGKANLSVMMTPGMRAVSIRSDDVAGVAGFVLPGDRVDILLTRSIGAGPTASTVTQVLAEDAQVVGVDQLNDTQADKPVVAKAVTVEVTPDQAQAISLAHAVGSISLALRQISDRDKLSHKITTVAELGGPGPRRVLDARPRARPRTTATVIQIRVTRGVDTTGYPIGSR